MPRRVFIGDDGGSFRCAFSPPGQDALAAAPGNFDASREFIKIHTSGKRNVSVQNYPVSNFHLCGPAGYFGANNQGARVGNGRTNFPALPFVPIVMSYVRFPLNTNTSKATVPFGPRPVADGSGWSNNYQAIETVPFTDHFELIIRASGTVGFQYILTYYVLAVPDPVHN